MNMQQDPQQPTVQQQPQPPTQQQQPVHLSSQSLTQQTQQPSMQQQQPVHLPSQSLTQQTQQPSSVPTTSMNAPLRLEFPRRPRDLPHPHLGEGNPQQGTPYHDVMENVDGVAATSGFATARSESADGARSMWMTFGEMLQRRVVAQSGMPVATSRLQVL